MAEDSFKWMGVCVFVGLICLLFLSLYLCCRMANVPTTIDTSWPVLPVRIPKNTRTPNTRTPHTRTPRPLIIILRTRNESRDANPITPPPSYEDAASAPPIELDKTIGWKF